MQHRQQQEERIQRARERKNHMLKLESLRIEQSKKSDSEVEREARDEAIREMAATKLAYNSEGVRTLETLASQAVTFTLRDMQLNEKKRRELEELEYNRRMDMVMEIERVKDLHRRDQEEQKVCC